MVRFYEYFLTMTHWQYLAPLCRLVKVIAASDRAKEFRAGQSMVTLLISTTSYHGLRDGDLCIAVDVHRPQDDEAPEFEIQYCPRNQKSEKQSCNEENVSHVLDEFMDRLWHDTKSG